MHPLVRVHDYQHNTLANIDSLMEIVLSGGVEFLSGDSGDIKAALHHLLWLFSDSWTSGTNFLCQANHTHMEPD